MHADARKLLWDAMQAADRVVRFTRGKTFDDYRADELLRSGVERQLAIVGEALARLRRIDPATAGAIAELPRASVSATYWSMPMPASTAASSGASSKRISTPCVHRSMPCWLSRDRRCRVMMPTPHACERKAVHPRYAMHRKNEPVLYPESVTASFGAWMAQQESHPSPPGRGAGGEGAPADAATGRRFTDEQRWWLEKMAEHIASNLGIEAEDSGYAPFDQRGGLGRVYQLFGGELPKVIDELNRELVA